MAAGVLPAGEQGAAVESVSDQHRRCGAAQPAISDLHGNPNNILGQAITKHIVLQGFLTAGGKFQNMKTPGSTNPVAMQILALLDEWQFRPALRDKKPIDVEILLVIPARS